MDNIVCVKGIDNLFFFMTLMLTLAPCKKSESTIVSIDSKRAPYIVD